MDLAGLRAESRRGALPYAGEISPQQAWDQLTSEPAAILVDVRTPPEWAYAGEPDVSKTGKPLVKLSWKLFPSYQLNDQFCELLKSKTPDLDTPLLFLCRTGGRSMEAAMAMTSLGYTRCYNITDGFDGPLNPSRQRGQLAGWKASHLPWRQD